MKRKEDVILKNAGGECLLVPLGPEVMDMKGVIHLNETGGYVWSLLEQEQTLDKIVEAVMSRFSVTHDCASADVRSFLGDLARMGLLV